MAKVAFFTFQILKQARGHPDVQGFFDRIPRVFGAADQSDGFLDRVRPNPETGGYDWIDQGPHRFGTPDDPDGQRRVKTLTFWAGLESAFAFAYAGWHAEALAHAKEWILPPAWPPYAAWWVPDDYPLDWSDAIARHEYLHDHGPSPRAFDFKTPFGSDGNPVALDRALAKSKMERNALKAQATGTG